MAVKHRRHPKLKSKPVNLARYVRQLVALGIPKEKAREGADAAVSFVYG